MITIHFPSFFVYRTTTVIGQQRRIHDPFAPRQFVKTSEKCQRKKRTTKKSPPKRQIGQQLQIIVSSPLSPVLPPDTVVHFFRRWRWIIVTPRQYAFLCPRARPFLFAAERVICWLYDTRNRPFFFPPSSRSHDLLLFLLPNPLSRHHLSK